MSEEILKVLEKLKDKNNYQRDCNDGSYFIELFANEIYILCEFIEDMEQKVEQLEKENKILKENAEHNDKVVDKVNWENMLLKRKNKEIDRLNNIINGIEAYCNMAITMNFNMNNSKLQEQIVEDYTNVLNKLKELKDSD